MICGATGSAKTRVLQALAARGAQVLDLEELARHKGSLLGDAAGCAAAERRKPFETQIADRASKDSTWHVAAAVRRRRERAHRPHLALPIPLVERACAPAPCIEVQATSEARLAYLLRDYAYLGDDREALAAKMALLKALQGRETSERWQHWAREGELPPLFAELMTLHYDPHYTRSQERHFGAWAQRRVVPADDLSDASIARIAAGLLAG